MTTITDDYREQNRMLHESRSDYGARGHRHRDIVSALCRVHSVDRALDYGCGKGALARSFAGSHISVANYDPGMPLFDKRPEPAPLVVCTDVLEHIEPDCLDAVLRDLRDLTEVACYIVVCTRPDGGKTLPDGRDPHLLVRPASWWFEQLEQYFRTITDRTATGHARDAIFICYP